MKKGKRASYQENGKNWLEISRKTGKYQEVSEKIGKISKQVSGNVEKFARNITKTRKIARGITKRRKIQIQKDISEVAGSEMSLLPHY